MASLGEVVRIIDLIPTPPNEDFFTFPVSPNILDLFGHHRAGRPFFRNPLSGDITQCIQEIANLRNTIGSKLPPGSMGPIADGINEINESLTDVITLLGTFNSHINSALVGPLNDNPGFFAQVENSIRIRATQNALQNALNACQDLTDYMGSILGEGQDLLNKLVAPLGALIAAAAGTAEEILAVWSQIRSQLFAGQKALQDQIEKEISNLANMIADAISWAIANGIAAFVDDPCAQALFNAAGTSILLNSLPNLPRFP